MSRDYPNTVAVEPIPIAQISAFNTAGMRSTAIVLRMYCDGSSSRDAAYLTLASIGADDHVWADIEAPWRAVLSNFGVPYSHMCEVALRSKPQDSPFYGWDMTRQRAFFRALFNILGKERIFARLVPVSCTVAMNDYREIEQSTPAPVKPVHAVCVDYCIGGILTSHPSAKEGKIEVFFDKDERFIRYLESVWSRNKRKPEHWATHVATVASVDMIDVIPVQAADLLAWSMNRYYSRKSDEELAKDVWQSNAAMLTIWGARSALYGKEQLLNHCGFFNWTGLPKP